MSRAEYMREYRKKTSQKHKNQRQKQEDYEKQLKQTIEDNPFFDPDVNFYLHPISFDNLKKWHEENQKRFNLKCKIEGKIPTQQMYDDFNTEKDLKDRCVKYRLFSASFHKKYGKLPWHEMCLLNEVFKPDVSERPDLLHLFTPQPDDPDIYVITPDDWAAQDNFECNIQKYGFSPEDYKSFLRDRKTTNETRKEFIDFHHLPELFGVYTYNMKDHVFFA